MKKKILIVLLILVAIIAGIFIIRNINSRKYDYKIEEISEFNYYIYQENDQYGIIDKEGKEIVTVRGIISPLQSGAKTQFNTSMTLDYANTYDFKITLK